MRICILTQPLHTNYGGLLQTYALQTVLKRMGHEVWTEDRKRGLSFIGKIKLLIKRVIKYRGIYYPTKKHEQVISQNTDLFIRKYITTTEPISTSTKEEFKVEDGIYQRFSDDGVTPYYYMIREIGGIATHAYVDGSNTKYDENPYYNSNNTAEGYLLELGYIDNVKELENILDNPRGYAKGIALAIDEYLR